MSDPQQFKNETDPRFTTWWKSTRSNGSTGCLHIATGAGAVAIADSKLGPEGPIHVVDRGAWAAFVAGVKQGAIG